MDHSFFAKRFPDIVAGLPEDDIEAILQSLRGRILTNGDKLIEEGTDSSTAYLILDGSLGVTVGIGANKVSLGRVAAGDMVGEVSFVDDGPATATLVAQGPVTVLELTEGALNHLLKERPRAAGALQLAACRALAGHLRAADEEIAGLGPMSNMPAGTENESLLGALRGLLGLRS